MKNKYPSKRYLHLDHIRSYTKEVESYVENPKRISRHGFLPFLKFTKDYSKFLGYKEKETVLRKPKNRSIMFASHIDSFIYSYYGNIISKHYNAWAISHGIDECSIAYRNNKKGKSNIQFAAEVIQRIIQCQKCYIFVGDFTKFFDKLDHKYLKQCLKDVLQVSQLDKDYYQVLKSLMNYSYIDLQQLRSWLRQQDIDFEKEKCYFRNMKEFRDFQHTTKLIQKNKDSEGIPQGSAMSGLLANIYMIHADEEIHQIVQSYHGLYRRYSDDFIVVIPFRNECSESKFEAIREKLMNIFQEARVKLQPDKTELYVYENTTIRYFDSAKENNEKEPALTYLGFRFDGKSIFVRQRSVYKFYRGARKFIWRAKKHSIRKNSMILLRQPLINRLYMESGSKPLWDKKLKRITYGNFISYMHRAQKEFEKISGITCRILEQIKHRRKLIQEYRRAKQCVADTVAKNLQGSVTENATKQKYPHQDCHKCREDSKGE